MRTFTLQAGNSDKFWSIDVVGTAVTVHFGRTGTRGQTKTQTFATATEAEAHGDKLIASKVGKGYTETAPAGPSLVPAAPPAATAAAEAPRLSAPSAPQASSAVPAAPTAAVEPPLQPSPTPTGEWGLRLGRLEEAALGWGRPIDENPSQTTFSAAQADAWARAHIRDEHEWDSSLELTDLPFDHLPQGDEAAWWAAWIESGRSRLTPSQYHKASLTQRLKAVQEQLGGKKFDKLGERPHAFTEPNPFVHIALQLLDTPPAELLRRALRRSSLDPVQVPALRALVVRRLPAADLAELLQELGDTPAGRPGRPAPLDDQRRAIYSALVHSPAEHLALLDELPDDLFLDRTRPHYPLFRWEVVTATLTAVPGPADAARLWDRMSPHRHRHENGLRLRLDQYGLLLAVLGETAAEELTARICSTGQRETAQSRVETLADRLHGPRAAGLFARIARESKAPELAQQWLHDHVEATLGGTFVGKDRTVLTTLVRSVHGTEPGRLDRPVEDPVLASVIAEVRELADVPELVGGAEPDWWVEAVDAEAAAAVPDPKAKGALSVPTKLPPYVDPTLLPPVVLDGVRWRTDMLEQVLWSAAHGTNDPTLTPRPLVAAARDRLPARHRDALAIAVFDGWLGAGAPSAGRSFFLAAGYLGGDGFVQHLLPLVRTWPGESQHQRAVLGLRVLAATGTKAALQGISGLSAKSKFKGIQEAAQRSMTTLAALQGLSPEQLADRVVPDGGLDARGQRILDYGPRSFRLTLSPQGKLVVRDLDSEGKPVGKARTALPAPNSKDDAELAAASKAEFTVLRKQLTDLAKIQTARLEQAMVTGRRWTGQEHREYVATHPVLASLVQPLIWQIGTGEGRQSVRIAEVGEYLTLDEDVVVPADDDVISLAHPLHLTPDEITDWQQHLADYDLVAPIQQLDRPTFTLPAGTDLDLPASALPAGEINPLTLVGLLEKLGWRRSAPADAGVVHHLWLGFPDEDRAVIIDVRDGLYTGYLGESGDQRIEGAHVTTPAVARDTWYFDRQRDALPWSDLSDVAVSEALRALALVAEKMAG